MFTDHRQLMDAVTYNSPSQEPFLKTQTESRPPQRRIRSETAKKKGRVYFASTEDKMTGKWASGARERPDRPARPSVGEEVTPATRVAKYTSVALLFMQRDPTAVPFSLSLLQIPSPSHFRNRSCITCFFFRCAFMRRFVWEASAMRIIIVLNTVCPKVRSFHKFSHTSIHLNTCSRTHAIQLLPLIST